MSKPLSAVSCQSSEWHRHFSLCGMLMWIIIVVSGQWSLAQPPPPPPSELTVEDVPNDAGTALKIRLGTILRMIRVGEDDSEPLGFRLERSAGGEPFKVLAKLPADATEYVDQSCRPGIAYRYAVIVLGPHDTEHVVLESAPVTPVVSWFNWDKTFLFVATILVCGGLIISTEFARRGKPIYIRPIAGLQAIEEAVGRATEMGRPMLFIPGIQDLNEIQTVAGVTVLSHVAQTAAQYDMALDVPTTRPLVMTAARDAVQAGCLNSDRPDVYDPNKVYFVTDDQFSFVAHVCGRMLREKPAACFYVGQFYAESLLLAETGNSVGAIQIAGTAEASQLPFFVAACDYTLLGEEMFAASAYLSREPEQLGMLRGQDVAKLVAAVSILGGCWLRMMPAHFAFLESLLRKVISF